MSEPSLSGFASLRAKFEQRQGSVSPPSRARSPAGSFRSESSRPLSRVRTSFIAVEPSGQMDTEHDTKDLGGNSSTLAEGEKGGPPPSMNGGIIDKQEVNGHGNLPPSVAISEPKVTEETAGTESLLNGAAFDGADDRISVANPDKPVSTVEETTASMLPGDPKDEKFVSGGATPQNKVLDLGPILKGSPFEKEQVANAEVQKPSTGANPNMKTQSPKKANDSPLGKMNGKAKDTRAPMPKSNAPPRPANLETQPAAPSNQKPTEVNGGKDDRDIHRGPRTPKNTAPTNNGLPLGKASPKTGPSKQIQPKIDVGKKTETTKSNRISTALKPAPASSVAKSSKKPGSTSPSSSTKPRPKSPTRPVKLPAAATAPTAASAAKLDGAPPSTNEKKPGHPILPRGKAPVSSARDQVSSKQPHQAPKPGRTSLPGISKPAEKSKSRLSTASSKPSDASFLERMMRPTQSSSQKTHEKVEPKTPPRKNQGSKPKRISEISNGNKTELAETKAAQPVDVGEASSTAGADENMTGVAIEKSVETPA